MAYGAGSISQSQGAAAEDGQTGYHPPILCCPFPVRYPVLTPLVPNPGQGRRMSQVKKKRRTRTRTRRTRTQEQNKSSVSGNRAERGEVPRFCIPRTSVGVDCPRMAANHLVRVNAAVCLCAWQEISDTDVAHGGARGSIISLGSLPPIGMRMRDGMSGADMDDYVNQDAKETAHSRTSFAPLSTLKKLWRGNQA
eukprot:138225-Rhodomonas_salina.3